MQCAECGFEYRAGAKFCGECGVALAEPCRQCGHRNRPGARFCDSCGTALGEAETPTPGLKPEAERRQLTVMFCDLVGSTELSSRLDPEDLREVMRAYQDSCAHAIERFDGHIAQTLGDGLMVYFGYPRAHEDDAQRAVRAGLAIVDAIRALDTRLRAEREVAVAVRIGIHTGLVVAGELGGHDTRADMAVVGETPNVAARLQGLAEPNTVLLGAPTRRLGGDVFAYDDLGAQPLKGVAEPLALYRVAGERIAESRFAATHRGGITPLVGRDEEIALLMGRWREACEGDGQVVLLCGEPGIGKSRIADTLRERLSEPHLRLQYQCSPFYTNSAFNPFIAQLEHAAGFATEDDTEAKLDKLETVLAGDDAETCALFAALLSLPVTRYPPLNLSPQRQKERTIEALAAQLAALAGRRPTLLVWEDAHWIDPTSQEALDRLVASVAGLPVLAIVTFRPEFAPPWLGQAHVTLHTLNRLGRRQSAALATRVSDKPLPAALVEQITAKTDGVPLFIEELTKTVLESDLVTETQEGYALSGAVDAMTIPATLHDSLMARLDRLSEAKEVAQIGACIGREFSYEFLAKVSTRPDDELQDSIKELVNSELIFGRGAPPDSSYVFKHALVQDAAYESLLKSKRQSLHGKIVEALVEDSDQMEEPQPELLAHHYEAAGIFDAAIPPFLKAGQNALASWASDEAIAHLSKGLELLLTQTPSDDRNLQELDFQIGLGAALGRRYGWASQEFDASSRRASELRQGIKDADRVYPLLFRDWVFHLVTGNMAAVRASTREVHEVAQSHSSDVFLAYAESCSVLTLFFAGDFLAARNAMQRLLAVYDEGRHFRFAKYLDVDIKVLAQVYRSQTLWILGYADQARQVCDEMVAAGRRQGIDFQLSWILGWGNCAYQYCGQVDEFATQVNESMAIATEHQFASVTSQGDCFKGWAIAKQGQPKVGIAHIQQGLEAWEATGAGICAPYFRTFYAQVLGDAGQTAAALAEIDKAEAQVSRWQERWAEAETLRTKGELLLMLSAADANQSEDCFQRAIEVAQSQSAKSWELRAATSLARLWQSQGKRQGAHDLLFPVYDWFTEGFNTADLKDAKALLAELK